MTERGVPNNDMPNFSWRARGEAAGIPDADLAALLAGAAPPADASAQLLHVADVLAALTAAPGRDETAGEAAALAEFRQRVGVSSPLIRSRRRRPTLLSSLLSAKAAAVAAVAAVSLGGVATAAFANALPTAAQKFAHDTIGAPSPHASASANAGKKTNGHSGTPVGPNASGPAAFGLCTAYSHAKQHGTATQKAVAFRNLEKAAGGAANVASFCAAVKDPGKSAAPKTGPTVHPTSEPTHPSGGPTSHPSGPATPEPTSHPTGPPSNS
jgi:hypothetical protein